MHILADSELKKQHALKFEEKREQKLHNSGSIRQFATTLPPHLLLREFAVTCDTTDYEQLTRLHSPRMSCRHGLLQFGAFAVIAATCGNICSWERINIFVADMATEKAIVSGRRVTVVIWTTFMVLLLFVFMQPNFCSMSVEVIFGFSFFTLFSAATFPQCNCYFLIVANVGGAFWPILWHMMWHIILSWSAWKWRLCW